MNIDNISLRNKVFLLFNQIINSDTVDCLILEHKMNEMPTWKAVD